MLTSTSEAPGSLLKHIVIVFRAILKKLVRDTDFPFNKETLNIISHSMIEWGEEVQSEYLWYSVKDNQRSMEHE